MLFFSFFFLICRPSFGGLKQLASESLTSSFPRPLSAQEQLERPSCSASIRKPTRSLTDNASPWPSCRAHSPRRALVQQHRGGNGPFDVLHIPASYMCIFHGHLGMCAWLALLRDCNEASKTLHVRRSTFPPPCAMTFI